MLCPFDPEVAKGTSSEGGGIATGFGLRLVLTPGIVSDAYGSKLFTLIPPDLKTVREFKNHLAMNILKSIVPFHFFNGEYRISDEEDIRIFQYLDEPCRAVPVPQPKSALSASSSTSAIHTPLLASTPSLFLCGPPIGRSTPSENNNVMKRVQFSEDISYVEPPGGRGHFIGLNDSVEEVDSGSTKNVNIAAQNGQSPNGEERRSKKRKRHRKHKLKKKDRQSFEDKEGGSSDLDNHGEGATGRVTPPANENDIEEIDIDGEPLEINGEPPIKLRRGLGVKLKKSPHLNLSSNNVAGYEGDESDFSQSLSRNRKSPKGPKLIPSLKKPDSSSSVEVISLENAVTPPSAVSTSGIGGEGFSGFLSPNTAFSKTGYKRMVPRSASEGSKTSSSMEMERNASGTSSGYKTSDNSSEEVVKSGKRKDTPMLPRVLKNPCGTYELVKKSLNFEHESDDGPGSINTSDNRKTGNEKTEDFVEPFHGNGNGVANAAELSLWTEIDKLEQIEVGKTIKFKVLELNEVYTPEISDFKTATVIEVGTSGLTVQYTEGTGKKTRSGVYEIEDEELEGNSLDNPTELRFADLILPHILFQ